LSAVISVRPKITDLAFRVFGRSLHPELFEIFATRTIVRDQYQLQVDITSAGHRLTWQRDGLIISEVAGSRHQPLPANRLMFDAAVGPPSSENLGVQQIVDYSCSFQLDLAEPRVFATIQSELIKSAPCEGMVFQFQSSGRMALGAISYVNIQSRINRIHVRAFHTFPDASVVMKSESLFCVTCPRDEWQPGPGF
jgi:hypothetical protein